jgi:hypothetical protein
VFGNQNPILVFQTHPKWIGASMAWDRSEIFAIPIDDDAPEEEETWRK